jgi:ubiquitin carboxyl-terminal hydrolase 7
VLVNKQGHIEDLIQAFAKKAQIKDEQEGGRIRVYEIHHHKFFRELTPNYPVLSINDYADVIAERVPEEEVDADDRDFIKVIHFQADPSRVHGIPFKFLLKEVSLVPDIPLSGRAY